MVFSDLFFLFVFLPAFFVCYMVGAGIDRLMRSEGNAAKNMVLVVFSLVFYAWGEPVYVLLMVASVLLNYVVGLLIARRRRGRRAVLVAGVVCNLAVLATFKYLGFLASTLLGLGVAVEVPSIALPIGISFYTFQALSYLVDVYRREEPVQRKFSDLLLYISMFPQLIAGPIVRYGTVARELERRHVSAADFADGAFRFLIGLGKKVIVANQMSEIVDQFLVVGFDSLTTAGAWVGIVAFTFQIYFDFSGYSDMAIGMARCLGFHFKENFDHPYCCSSITDFWRRWHISLGSFFRDYVYIPMGGNRRHQAVNILVVWFLTGLWHGASWNFVTWGLYFGLIVMAEKYTLLRVKDRIPAVVLHVYSLAAVVVGWGIFYFEDFGAMLRFFHAFAGGAATGADFVAQSALTDHFWLWVAAAVFSMPVRRGVSALTARVLSGHAVALRGVELTARLTLSLALLVLSVALLVGATNNAFIYTRF